MYLILNINMYNKKICFVRGNNDTLLHQSSSFTPHFVMLFYTNSVYQSTKLETNQLKKRKNRSGKEKETLFFFIANKI